MLSTEKEEFIDEVSGKATNAVLVGVSGRHFTATERAVIQAKIRQYVTLAIDCALERLPSDIPPTYTWSRPATESIAHEMRPMHWLTPAERDLIDKAIADAISAAIETILFFI